MKRNNILIMILALAMVLAITACGNSNDSPASSNPDVSAEETDVVSDGKSYVLTFSSFMPAGSPYDVNVITYMNDQLMEKSGGRLSLDVYPGESLLTNLETVDGIEVGAADIGLTYMSIAPGRFPLSSIFELPYYYASGEAISNAFAEFFDKHQEEFSEFSGVKILFVNGAGAGPLVSHTKYASLDDLSGVQVSVNSTLAKSVAALGATPVTLGMAENYEAIRTGVVDAYIGSYESLCAFGYEEIVEYATAFPLLNATFALMMNKDSYDNLPADLQTILEDVMADVWETKVSTFFDVEGYKGMLKAQESGVEFYDLPPGTLDKMLELTSPVIDEYIEELNGLGYDGTAMITEYKELMDKYNEMYPYSYQDLFKIN